MGELAPCRRNQSTYPPLAVALSCVELRNACRKRSKFAVELYPYLVVGPRTQNAGEDELLPLRVLASVEQNSAREIRGKALKQANPWFIVKNGGEKIFLDFLNKRQQSVKISRHPLSYTVHEIYVDPFLLSFSITDLHEVIQDIYLSIFPNF